MRIYQYTVRYTKCYIKPPKAVLRLPISDVLVHKARYADADMPIWNTLLPKNTIIAWYFMFVNFFPPDKVESYCYIL